MGHGPWPAHRTDPQRGRCTHASHPFKLALPDHSATRCSHLLQLAAPPPATHPPARQAATDGYGGGFQGHLQHMKWEFAVINSPQVQWIALFTRLIRCCMGLPPMHEQAGMCWRSTCWSSTRSPRWVA